MDLILGVIVACEIGFWVLVVLGLLARYVVRRPRTGAVLLAMTPVVDLVLLAAVIVDLRAGGTAGFFHGLAALYLGISITYGRKMVHWADVRFAHRFADGAAPVRLYGWEYTKECWKDVLRTAIAAGVAAGILWLLTILVEDPSSTHALLGIYPVLGLWFAIDLIWTVSYTIWPRTPRVRTPTTAGPSRLPG